MNINFTEYHSSTYSWRKWNNGFKEYWERFYIPSLAITSPEGSLYYGSWYKNFTSKIFSQVYNAQYSVPKGNYGIFFTAKEVTINGPNGWFFADMSVTFDVVLDVYVTGV